MPESPTKRHSFFTLAIAFNVVVFLVGQFGTASATPEIAELAPAFTGTDSRDKNLSTADLRSRNGELE